jgi:hypothetical protein
MGGTPRKEFVVQKFHDAAEIPCAIPHLTNQTTDGSVMEKKAVQSTVQQTQVRGTDITVAKGARHRGYTRTKAGCGVGSQTLEQLFHHRQEGFHPTKGKGRSQQTHHLLIFLKGVPV